MVLPLVGYCFYMIKKRRYSLVDNLNKYGRAPGLEDGSVPAVLSRVATSKMALGISALTGLAAGGLFLIYYPLPTIFVGLLMASVFVLERG